MKNRSISKHNKRQAVLGCAVHLQNAERLNYFTLGTNKLVSTALKVFSLSLSLFFV
jgi:hypothetical protein